MFESWNPLLCDSYGVGCFFLFWAGWGLGFVFSWLFVVFWVCFGCFWGCFGLFLVFFFWKIWGFGGFFVFFCFGVCFVFIVFCVGLWGGFLACFVFVGNEQRGVPRNLRKCGPRSIQKAIVRSEFQWGLQRATVGGSNGLPGLLEALWSQPTVSRRAPKIH